MKLLSVLALLTFSALVSADNRDGIPGRISRSHVQPSVASARISVGNGNGSSRPRTQNKISDFPGLTNVDDPPTSSSSSPSPPSPPSPPPPAWQASRALINPADDTFTNAERMRRGLPLKAPRRRSRLSRTRTVAARAPAPSPTYCGRLRVETSDSRYSGYVAQNLDDQGRYVVTPDRARAASVYYRDHQLHPMVCAI